MTKEDLKKLNPPDFKMDNGVLTVIITEVAKGEAEPKKIVITPKHSHNKCLGRGYEGRAEKGGYVVCSCLVKKYKAWKKEYLNDSKKAEEVEAEEVLHAPV